MRQIADRLDETLERRPGNFIDQERQQNRGREAADELQHRNVQRILDHGQELRVFQECEVIQACPCAVPDRGANLKILEGHLNAGHGDIAEQKQQDYPGQDHQILPPVFVEFVVQSSPP